MKAVVTVIGKDKPGIIASVSGLLAEHSVNIEDISQTIMSGNFNDLGKRIGVSIHVQHEDIFNAMHKI